MTDQSTAAQPSATHVAPQPDSANPAPRAGAAPDSTQGSSREGQSSSSARRPLREQMAAPRDELLEAVNANTARDFGALLRLLENGKLHQSLSTQYHELIDELKARTLDTGNEVTGTLALTLSFSLKNGTCAIQADSTVKTPKRKRDLSMMFLTPENNLSRLNPDQLEMFQDRGIRSV